ncbi:MAG: hypothetical protein RIT38_1066 [Bacteroidota bacterium]|jgi:GNAT superfamily N-acetyltransferase
MDTIEIVNYKSSYKEVFRDLNVEWISTYFKMEASDYKALDNADRYILQNGGYILVALLNKEPVGVCALIKMEDPKYDFELAKMAVAPKAQGKKIGWLIGEAIKDKARSIGAKTLYLESNTMLIPAINLYRKLGFMEVFGRDTPYERCNIQMALAL